jgi:type II secretory pathway component PulK
MRTEKDNPGLSRENASRGYILLFTLGVLSVIAVLALSVASSVRLEATSVQLEKVRLQQEYALRGAAHRAVAILDAHAKRTKLDAAQNTPVPKRDSSAMALFPFSFELNGFSLTVEGSDASLWPRRESANLRRVGTVGHSTRSKSKRSQRVLCQCFARETNDPAIFWAKWF